MQTMTQDIKNQIRQLEHRKIDLNEQLSMTNSTARFKEIEEELYESFQMKKFPLKLSITQ